MTTVLSTCLRYLLILALGLKVIVIAHATVPLPVHPAHFPPATALHLPADTAPATARAASHAQHDHCHDAMARAADANPASPEAPEAPAHGCCKGGVCACTCAAPAVIAAVFVATPVPLVHERTVTLIDYRPSHLLPLPFRPPIA